MIASSQVKGDRDTKWGDVMLTVNRFFLGAASSVTERVKCAYDIVSYGSVPWLKGIILES